MTVRLRDARGRATAARVRLFTGLGSARLSGLLEDADGPPLPLVDGAAEAAVPTAGMVTLALSVPGRGPTIWNSSRSVPAPAVSNAASW